MGCGCSKRSSALRSGAKPRTLPITQPPEPAAGVQLRTQFHVVRPDGTIAMFTKRQRAQEYADKHGYEVREVVAPA